MKKLVRTSFVTSVEVPDNASREEIITATSLKLINQVVNELSENLDEIVDDIELPTIILEKDKDIAETVCKVRVLFTDENGKHLEGIAEHNGDEDCWDCIIIDEIYYDINTYDTRVFGDRTKQGAIGVSVDKLVSPIRNGEISRDGAISMTVNKIEIIAE